MTGAGGFCGSRVAAAAAARGADVLWVGRRPGPTGRHLAWDAAREVPDLSGADIVVHCAAAVGDPAPGSPAEAAMRAVNVDGAARLLQGAVGRPVVWVSSASVYAPGPGRLRVTEGHPVRGHLNAYGRTKAAGEALALAAGAVVLRPRAPWCCGHGRRGAAATGGLRHRGPAPGAQAAVPRPPRTARGRAAGAQRPPQPRGRGEPHRRLSAGRRLAGGRVQHRRSGALRPGRGHPDGPARARRTGAHPPHPAATGSGRGGHRPDTDPAASARGAAAHPLRRRPTGASVVLDVSKAQARGWVAGRTLEDYGLSLPSRSTV
nr:NAD(P)-dependent oxidoreductase [Streptomyces aureocirculatus]